MVEAGKGKEKTKFKDVNQGKTSKKKMKAKVYLSWFAPKVQPLCPETPPI